MHWMEIKVGSRRAFMTGLISSASLPIKTWADVGTPKFLSAGKYSNGEYALFGINIDGKVVFEIPVTHRAHAATTHPSIPHAVAFARRPGYFAIIINCLNKSIIKKLIPPKENHFYGHGCYIKNGTILVTTENEIETGKGLLGLWDSELNYRRIGQIASGGIGPHEVKALPNEMGIVVANGGIRTHPKYGRKKLNLEMMRSNISFFDLNYSLKNKLKLPKEMQLNSIRHLDVSAQGKVAFGTQWQGDQSEIVPLVGYIDQMQTLTLIELNILNQSELKGYIGSVAINGGGSLISATSPRGGISHIYNNNTLVQKFWKTDICGVASVNNGFAFTNGSGSFFHISNNNNNKKIIHTKSKLHWDNHLISL